MVRRRGRCIEVDGVNKGPWTEEEDAKLAAYVRKYGQDNWRALPKLAGLKRCGKSCRLRWINYLSPHVKRGNFTKDEEEIIIRLHAFLGNKWSKIASCLPGRTDSEVKNMWHTYLKKRVQGESSAQIPHGKKKTRRLPQDHAYAGNGCVDGGSAARLDDEELTTQITNSHEDVALSSSYQELNCSSTEYSCVTSLELFQNQSWPLYMQQQQYYYDRATDQQDGRSHPMEIGDLSTVDPEEVWRFVDQGEDDDYCFMQSIPTTGQVVFDDPLGPPGAVAKCNINVINVSAGSGDQEQEGSSSCSGTWDAEKDRWLEYLEKELEL